MSHNTTATRGIAPASLSLITLPHMPKPPKTYDPGVSLGMPASTDMVHSPMTSDEEDIFDLNMVTMNMDFEQAYLMYNKLQQKNFMAQVDQLHKAQELSASMARTQQYVNSQRAQAVHAPATHISSSVLGTSIATPQVMHAADPPKSQELKDSVYFGGANNDDNDDSMDQFFTNNESKAIERFLDNLSGGRLSNADTGVTSVDSWCRSREDQDFFFADYFVEEVKKEITNAFQHPAVLSLRSFGTPLNQTQMGVTQTAMRAMNELQTDMAASPGPQPVVKREISRLSPHSDTYPRKRRFSSESSESPDQASKHNNGASKELLSDEQKRLNHSLLEQKRRLLCREAYERCLRLVTNVEDYKREMAQAGLGSQKRKPSRKQFIKNGLPNLSKHTSLKKISTEISKLQEQNNQLRVLLAERV